MKAFDNKETGLITSIDLKQTRIKALYWIVFAIVLAVALVCLFPILWIILSSFKDVKEFVSTPPTLWPHSFHPEIVASVWKKMNMSRSYLNTMVLALGDVMFSIVFNGLAGYVISRLKPKGASFLFMLILWSMMLPTSVNLVPLFATYQDFPIFHFSMMDTYFPMWLGKGANAFNVLLFKSFFDSISISYIEAARIDGCSDLGIFRRIILPLSKPIVVTVAIFAFNISWADFLTPYLVLKTKSLYTVPVQIFRMKTAGFLMNEYVIVLFFSMIPSMIMFLLFQDQIMHGMNLGGIKG